MKCILVIAGSDSSGGAGIQADIKTITSLGAHSLTVLTAVTAQNSFEVAAVHKIPARFISRQLETVLKDFSPHAVKIGMLYSGAAVKTVAGLLKKHNLINVVLDPVMRASSGKNLLEPDAVSLFKEILLPLVSVVTPNLYEARVLAGKKVGDLEEMAAAAKVINAMGPDVVVTGGHLTGDCVDLFCDGRQLRLFQAARILTEHTHGSGCVFSTALATFLAEGENSLNAAGLAHDFTKRAIKTGYALGQGPGPVQAGLGRKPNI